MSDSGKAVFLSYASQDVEAAKRIADALRAAGVEVWFDQSELVGGDAWDQKIRKQIKDCALLIPIISAATQARTEGYFRLEWRLADQRTHLMAKGRAFLLPVVIDDTRDAEAHVPDSFTEVQWTRLRQGYGGQARQEGEDPALRKFVIQVKKLLDGTEPEAGRHRPAVSESVVPSAHGLKKWWWALPIFGVTMALLLVMKEGRKEAPPVTVEEKTAGPAAPAARDWPKNPELKKAMNLTEGLEAIPDDLALAEEMVKRALDRSPTDVETVTVMARLQAQFMRRGFDRSDERAALAKRYAERALQLAPDEPEAMYALATYHFSRGTGETARTEQLLRRAMELDPSSPRPGRLLADLYNVTNRPTEALAQGQDNVRRFPNDVLSHYDLARNYKDQGRYEEFDRELDATLALAPLPNAIVWKARLQFGLRNDFAGMKTWLDRVPARVRGTERAVFGYFLYAAFGDDPEVGLGALRDFPQKWFTDFEYAGPTALLNASLLELQGKKELARRQYEGAYGEIQRMRQTDPARIGLSQEEFWILLGLGRTEEALTCLRRVVEGLRRPYFQDMVNGWWFTAIPGALLVGDRVTALTLLRESVDTQPASRAAFRLRFQIDPRMAPFRNDPEIVALLAEPKPQGATVAPKADLSAIALAKVDDKSVAVLAFANLSDDKANEYFSDGISEELLNVLAKVPKLKVAARTSSFYFKGRNEPIPEIAKKLGVAYVVEGSVRKAGNKVRITAQLIKAADGFHVWSETYDRDLSDIFAVQDEIAKNILGVVKGSLLGEAELPHLTTTKIEAYTLFLQASGSFAKRGEANLREAIRLYEAALVIDPDYVPALVGMAKALVVLPNYAYLNGVKMRETAEAGNRAARRVLQLDPQNAAAHASLGWTAFQFDWKWTEGTASIQLARDLAPNDSWNWNILGDCHRFHGDFVQALADKQRAWELDPLSPNSHWDLAYTYLVAGRHDEAIQWSEKCIALAPHNMDSYMPGILAAGRSGRFELMRRLLADTRRNVHEAEGMMLLLESYGAILERKPGEAHRLLALAEPLAEAGSGPMSYVGLQYLLLGEPDRAAYWLQRAAERHDPTIIWSEVIDLDLIAANPKTKFVLDQPQLKELHEIRQRNARAGLNKL